MKRRTFLKAAAAAGAAATIPGWWHQQRQFETIDLQPFCLDYRGTRFDLRKPYSSDDRTFATNGRLIIAIDRVQDVAAEAGRIPLDESIALPWHSSGYVTWRRQRVSDDRCLCPRCDGDGLLDAQPCPSCEEGHLWDDDAGDYAWCHRCKGREIVGEIVCPRCAGKGELDYAYAFNGWHYAPHLVERFEKLGPLEATVAGTLNGAQLMGFRFAQGQGLIMPLNRKRVG